MRLFLVTSISCLAVLLHGSSLWKDGNLFSSRVPVLPGDIVKIRFATTNIIRYRNEMKGGETRKSSLGTPGVQAFSFLPALDYNASVDDNRRLEYQTERELRATIAVRVTGVSNNILALAGSHSITMNGHVETIGISGEVRLEDLREENTILSTDIANLMMVYQGPSLERGRHLQAGDLVYPLTNGAGTNLGPAGSGSASRPELSEDVRRRMVLQYLNRVIDLLFR